MNDAPLSSSALPSLVAPKFPALSVLTRGKWFCANDKSASVVVLAWAVRLVALLNMLNAVSRYQPKFIYWLGSWVPFEISEGYRFRMFLTSLVLLLLASGLQRGKHLAWQLTIGGLMLAPLLHLGRAVIWPQAGLNLALIGFLIYHRRHFVARSDERSVRSALVACSVLLVGLIVFGTLRFHALHKQTAGDRTWPGCFQTACELVLAHNSQTQHPLTAETRGLFVCLRAGGTTVALIGLILLLRPVLLRQKPSEEEVENARRLIEWYGEDPLNSYAFLEDKSYFFACEGEAVISYVLSNNIAVALVDPVGPHHARAGAIEEFVGFCRIHDWEPVFYAATDELRDAYEEAGLSLFKIGEGARLRSDEFLLKGNDFQNLRTICNRAHRLGLQFQWYDGSNGIDRWTERQLVAISQRWLGMKKAREMAFDMGSFSIEEIRRNGAAIALDSSGVHLAFATWRPFAQNRGRALDLMRHLPEARNVMDYVLVESIARFRALGIHDVSLGLAPLANTTKEPALLGPEEKAVRFLFENLNQVYGYKSLFEFKRKYRPKWKGRYVAYRRGSNLPLVGMALARVHAEGGILGFLWN
jgi:phosphatidylglycerol lysyltransferase